MNISDVKQLREETLAGIAECKRALEEAKGDMAQAKSLLNEWGVAKAAKKGDRETSAGVVDSYIHAGGSVGALVSLGCETDFVARTDDFKKLAHEIAMQVAAMNPKSVDDLMKQAYIRDAKLTVEDLIKQTIAKVGENIKVVAMVRQKV